MAVCEHCGLELTAADAFIEAVEVSSDGEGGVLQGRHVIFHQNHYPFGVARYQMITRTTRPGYDAGPERRGG